MLIWWPLSANHSPSTSKFSATAVIRSASFAPPFARGQSQTFDPRPHYRPDFRATQIVASCLPRRCRAQGLSRGFRDPRLQGIWDQLCAVKILLNLFRIVWNFHTANSSCISVLPTHVKKSHTPAQGIRQETSVGADGVQKPMKQIGSVQVPRFDHR
jgi:hypothetical protein